MILMQAPGPNLTFGAMPSGATYVSDQYGLVRLVNDSAADQSALIGLGCFTLSPFGGWGTYGFGALADLYAADTGSLFYGITGFPRWTIAQVFSDPTSSNDGAWSKTGTGNGSGAWTKVAATPASGDAIAAAASAAAAAASANQALQAAQNAAAAVGAALSADVTAAAASAAVALQAAQAAADGLIYPTYAAAAAVAPRLLNGQLVQVLVDETRSFSRSVYQVSAGALVFEIVLTQPQGGTMNFVEVAGSPFPLAAGWQLACTVSGLNRALVVADVTEGPAQHDIFWTSVAHGAAAPASSVKGLPVGEIERFLMGVPVGDIYLRSDSGATATVQVGS